MKDVVLHRLPTILRLPERAAITYAKCVGSVGGNPNASIAKYGFAMTTIIGLRVRRQEMTHTESVEEWNVLPETSR